MPLSDSDRNCLVKIFNLFKGHWSPVIGYLEEPDLCLLLDVNETKGAYLVPLERLYWACNTRQFYNGYKRGIIKIKVWDFILWY